MRFAIRNQANGWVRDRRMQNERMGRREGERREGEKHGKEEASGKAARGSQQAERECGGKYGQSGFGTGKGTRSREWTDCSSRARGYRTVELGEFPGSEQTGGLRGYKVGQGGSFSRYHNDSFTAQQCVCTPYLPIRWGPVSR